MRNRDFFALPRQGNGRDHAGYGLSCARQDGVKPRYTMLYFLAACSVAAAVGGWLGA